MPKHRCEIHGDFNGNHETWNHCPVVIATSKEGNDYCNRESPIILTTQLGCEAPWNNSWLGGLWQAPNTSGGFHGILNTWWNKFGLGQRCLLSSESSKTRRFFEKHFPNTKFVATDKEGEMDVCWDVCGSIKDFLNDPHMVNWINNYDVDPMYPFDSVISHAQLEHIINPFTAIHNFTELVSKGGYIYIMTQGTMYEYHAHPRNYMHFFMDYFIDLPKYLPNEIKLVDWIQVPFYTKECKTMCLVYQRLK